MDFMRYLILLCLAFFSIDAVAGGGATSCTGLVNEVLCKFQVSSSTWSGRIETAATWIFFALATISFVWTFGLLGLKKAELGEVGAELIVFVVTTGFFLWLLLNGPDFASRIVMGLLKLAGEASGAGEMNPSGVIDVGFSVFERIFAATSAFSPFDSIVGLIVGFIILVILALVAFNMAMLMIASWFLGYAGIFILGFGGGKWTSDMAVNFYKTVLGIGIQLYSMVLIISVGLDIIKSLESSMSAMSFTDMGAMLLSAIFLLLMVNNIPGLLASPITGGGGAASMGIGNFGAGAAIGAGAALAASAGMATQALEKFGLQLGGMASMMKAAYGESSDNMASGGGMFSGAAPSSGMMGMAGMFAADMASNLASGIGKEAKSMYAEKMGAAQDATSQTFGGRVASQIQPDFWKKPDDAAAETPGATGGDSSATGSTEGSTASQGQSDSWMSKSGGFDALSPEDQEVAREMHSEWKQRDPERHDFNIDDYVNYVQERHQND